MSSQAIYPGQFGGYPIAYSTASSSAADAILDLFLERDKELNHTVFGTRLGPIYQSLQEIEASCLTANWDGEGAAAVRKSALQEAATLAESLPSWVPLPEVAADPTGDIGFEWSFGPERVLVVSVGGENRLVFAALLGGGMKQHGIELYNDTVPTVVLRLLERVCPRSRERGAERTC